MATDAERDAVVAEFKAELEAWRAERPAWTEELQHRRFPHIALWQRAGGKLGRRECDGPLYRSLMVVAGYVIPTGERAE